MKFSKNVVRSTIGASAMAASMLVSTLANAQWITLDPANLIQNIIGAVEAVAQEAEQIKQYEEMVKTNTAGLGGEQFINGSQLSQLNKLSNSAQSLKQSLGSGASSIQNIQSLYGASNAPNFQSFAQSLAQRKAAGDANASNLLAAADAATQQIQSSQDAHQKVVAATSGVSGVTEAAQATAAAVGTVVEQNQAFLGTMSAMATDRGVQRAKEAQAESDTASMSQKREQENAAALSRLQSNASLN